MKHYTFEYIEGVSQPYSPLGNLIDWSSSFEMNPDLRMLANNSGCSSDIGRIGFPLSAGLFTEESAKTVLKTHVDSDPIRKTYAIHLNEHASIDGQLEFLAQKLTAECPGIVGHIAETLKSDFRIFGNRVLLVRLNFDNRHIEPNNLRAPLFHTDKRVDCENLISEGKYDPNPMAQHWNYPLGRVYISRIGNPDNSDLEQEARPIFVDLSKCLSREGVINPALKRIGNLPLVGRYRSGTDGLFHSVARECTESQPTATEEKLARIAHLDEIQTLGAEGLIIRPGLNEIYMIPADRFAFHCSGSPTEPVRAPYLRIMVQPIMSESVRG